MKYDIFISYKRKGTSSATAAYLYELLQQKGYNVFFDRKEMRSGKFNEQILEHISNATDIIILLEKESLSSWFDYRTAKKSRFLEDKDSSGRLEPGVGFQEEPYKTDWFCKEIMYALSLEGKNVVPILLNGFGMPEEKDLPPEMKDLSLHQALSLEISEVEEFYEKYFVEQGYLKSKPANLSLTKRFQSRGGVVGCFLFYTEVDSCDLYECGDKIATLTDDEDEWHPFRYPVNFAGEHRFRAINNDSCEIVTIRCSVETNCQQYVQIQFTDTQDLWQLTKEEIAAQSDAERLYNWGRGLFDGTTKHEPDIALSFECLQRAIDLGSQDALSFVASYGWELVPQKQAPDDVAFKWYTIAAEQGNMDALCSLGEMYFDGEGVEQNYEAAFVYYMEAAERGIAYGQKMIGYMFERGLGVKQDYEEAYNWYKKSAEKGYPGGMSNLGELYFQGLGVEQDYGKALDWFIKAAEQGDVIALARIGQMYEKGLGVEQDYQKAFEWYLRAAQLGEVFFQNIVGDRYSDGLGVGQNYGKAFEWRMKAAEQGDVGAQLKLGLMYLMGQGVENDDKKAFEWLHMAAEQGAFIGEYLVGNAYDEGRGVEQDYGKAFEWYMRAAEHGYMDAQVRIGEMYDIGLGVEQDYGKAFEWYMRAAEQGDAKAQVGVGELYFVGDGVKQDYGKAFEWYMRAAEQDYAEAQYEVGLMYEDGNGVNQNYKKALEWYMKAAEQGHTSSLNSVAWVYHLLGDYSKALPWAEKGVAAMPNDPAVVDTLATVYEGLGRNNKALEQFEKCLRLYKEDGDDEGEEETKQKIDALKKKMQRTGNRR